MRAALYLRVSTANGQTTDNQRLELEATVGRNGWQVVEINPRTRAFPAPRAGRSGRRLIACLRRQSAASSM